MNHSETYISQNIRFLKQARNYTRKQLAGLLEVKECALASWLEGRARPRLEELIKLADHFEITLDVLIRTDMKRWYIVRTGYKLEKIVEQGPKLVIEQ